MKIQIASDLHLEFLQRDFPGERVISPAPDADLLILAGDIGTGLLALSLFSNWPVPVLYVPGNHEFYGCHHTELLNALRELSAQHKTGSVLVLDNDVADFSRFEHWHAKHREELTRLRFLGSTLWTDYRLPHLNRTQRQQMEAAQLNLADHRIIKTDAGMFKPEDALRIHEESRAWLQRELDKPFEGKTVVVTHHGPHKDSTHPRWTGNSVNGAFMSHLPELVQQADLWVHGHVHDTFEYSEGKCQVVANPRGYGLNLRSVDSMREVQWENRAFQQALVVEV